MDSMIYQSYNFIKNRTSHKNRKLLLSLVSNILALFIFNSIVFLLLMHLEGQSYSIWDALYWTLTIFTTLGLGDIVFNSAVGHIFTIWVLLSGILAFFILTPYIFYQFFQSEARAPRRLRHKMSGHIVIIGYNHITRVLIDYLIQYRQSYTIVTADIQEGLILHDQGVHVVIGDINDPETYKNVRIKNAAMIVAAENDMLNANIALTIREHNVEAPIIATASIGREDILNKAGCNRVITPDEMIGRGFARRIIAGDAVAHYIGKFENFIIAESSVANTPIVGKTLREARIREICGLNAIGIWERGRYLPAGPDTIINKNSILVLAGTEDQFDNYNALLCIYNVSDPLVAIIGGGKVGRVVANELEERGVRHKVIEAGAGFDPLQDEDPNYDHKVIAEMKECAASAIIITTANDDLNILLTLRLREMKPDIQIISRSISEKNVSTLYQAGADFVISYAAIGASAILNIIRGGDLLIITEGLNIHRLNVPQKLAGKKIGETDVRKRTGCSIVAVQTKEEIIVNPSPQEKLVSGDKIYIIGNMDAEKVFYRIYTQKS